MTAKIGQGNSTHDDHDGCRMIPGLSARTSVAPEVIEVSGTCGNCEALEVSGMASGYRLVHYLPPYRFSELHCNCTVPALNVHWRCMGSGPYSGLNIRHGEDSARDPGQQ